MSQTKRRTIRKSGEIRIIKRSDSGSTIGKQKVYGKCVIEDTEHLMHLFTDSDYKHSYGFLNLKKCTVSLCSDEKRICISKSPDLRKRNGPEKDMVLQAENEESAAEWIASLSIPESIPEERREDI
jgi:hypothetical protein